MEGGGQGKASKGQAMQGLNCVVYLVVVSHRERFVSPQERACLRSQTGGGLLFL